MRDVIYLYIFIIIIIIIIIRRECNTLSSVDYKQPTVV